MHINTWNVEIFISEHDDMTNAEAVLHTADGREIRHSGHSRRSPKDPEVPEIGDELAVCRALAGLSHALFEASLADVELNVGKQPSFIA
jgi:hypothetical protein